MKTACQLPLVQGGDAEAVVAAELVGAALASRTVGLRLVLRVDTMREALISVSFFNFHLFLSTWPLFCPIRFGTHPSHVWPRRMHLVLGRPRTPDSQRNSSRRHARFRQLWRSSSSSLLSGQSRSVEPHQCSSYDIFCKQTTARIRSFFFISYLHRRRTPC